MSISPFTLAKHHPVALEDTMVECVCGWHVDFGEFSQINDPVASWIDHVLMAATAWIPDPRLGAPTHSARSSDARHCVYLSDYEVANLRAALESTGYGTWPHELYAPSPLGVLNTGDWLGQIVQKLPPTEQAPNQTWDQLNKRAREWSA